MTGGPWDDPRVRAGLAELLARRRALLHSGAAPIGWKVGFGAPGSLELMQISAPLLGFLTDASLLPSGATVAASAWERGIVEFEVAVYLGSDLGPYAGEDAARSAVSAIGPAIELANIDMPIRPEGVSQIVAGNIFHRGVVLGTADSGRAGIDISGLTARISVDGAERHSTTDLEAITGRYPDIVSTVATTLASQGERLRKGDVIITGSVIPPIPVTDGTQFSFVLEPLESISVVVA